MRHLADHIDYVVNLIGIDHVKITSDFNSGGGIEGWNGTDEAPKRHCRASAQRIRRR